MIEDKFKQKPDKNKGIITPSPPDDEVEEAYMYDVRKPMLSLNDGENDVFDIKKQTGINSAKSVFDKGSIFRTS